MSNWVWIWLLLWLVAVGVVIALFRAAHTLSNTDEHEEGV